MSGIRESLDPVSHNRLRRFLERARMERFTGTLQVYGRPGGALNLRNGLVMAAVSPGAPGMQALLARTGRTGDEDRVRTGGVARPAAGGAIGAARLQVMQVMATQDALFAMLAGTVDSCSFENEGKALEGTGDDPSELLDRAFRKLEALANLPKAILPHRERLALTDAAIRPDPATPEATGSDTASIRDNILRYADGRTARDIAFVAARSLYVVTIEMSRMLAEGLLREMPPAPVDTGPEVLPPRPAPRTQRAADPVPESGRPEFPRRQPGQSGGARRGFLWLGGRSGDDKSGKGRSGNGRT